MSSLTAFAPDYATARRRFREAATRLGWELEAHRIDPPHPVGQELTIDVATSPRPGSGPAVVVSSGLHGVEGFFGSAVQVGLLEQWVSGPSPPSQVRYVFLHALNPYGFACVRRQNEENVDPNRNFLEKGESYSGSPPGYAALNELLNPERPPSRWEPFTLRALFAIARLGMPALKQTIAGGQFDYARGLFFGGSKQTRTHEIVRDNLGRWVENCPEVIHLDFHTGLGSSATYKLLIDYPLTEKQKSWLTDGFGPDSFEICAPEKISYHVRGGFDRWCQARNTGRVYMHACAEFGTYGPIHVLGGLRAENQAHHWGKPTDPATLRAKQRLKELFCPASPAWREASLSNGIRLVDQATRCLIATPGSGGNQ
jgi:hypothetical protein